ncbi:MAG: hypothetical protein CBB87_11370 [Micavibrio sp. TMED27]|nr:hypothetical protein [Micavibrio sp.]OUT89893.1 MAG: hypothetical protein CBB87_11370 [Micavibrio sp. TMED27]|tara:strand:+ start:904 stop:1317 length:414 start_codon:yes stop_codon:yes gene_type:complete
MLISEILEQRLRAQDAFENANLVSISYFDTVLTLPEGGQRQAVEIKIAKTGDESFDNKLKAAFKTAILNSELTTPNVKFSNYRDNVDANYIVLSDLRLSAKDEFGLNAEKILPDEVLGKTNVVQNIASKQLQHVRVA